jgi:hypothetical protein
MDREQYFDMCEQLGTEPVPEDIPVEFEDFILEVQQAFQIYNLLRDEWDSFSGVYLGKSLIGITEIFDISGLQPEDRYITVVLVKMIDRIRATELNRKHQKPAQ